MYIYVDKEMSKDKSRNFFKALQIRNTYVSAKHDSKGLEKWNNKIDKTMYLPVRMKFEECCQIKQFFSTIHFRMKQPK